MDEQFARAARDAAAEIRSLRRQNELLAAKVHVMEFFECVLHTRPAQPSTGYAEDVAWKLEKMVEEAAADAKAASSDGVDAAKAEG